MSTVWYSAEKAAELILNLPRDLKFPISQMKMVQILRLIMKLCPAILAGPYLILNLKKKKMNNQMQSNQQRRTLMLLWPKIFHLLILNKGQAVANVSLPSAWTTTACCYFGGRFFTTTSWVWHSAPITYFKLFSDTSITKKIAEVTNLYSVQKTGTSINTNEKGIEQLLGILMKMAAIRMPNYEL